MSGNRKVFARHHIQTIRKDKFSIGAQALNPLRDDLHQSVKIFSAELYAKDVHFLMELIQNAEDNEYPEGAAPSLEFVVTSRDITGTGASSTLLVFNNEKGFSAKNIDSICSVGGSTKKCNFGKRGYIGEKGIGFKSVFLISSKPYIFSNGYQIRFSEEPCSHCNIGYIVPEWVEDASIISNLQIVYGPTSTLPTTTLVLPLKPEKINIVKKQLSSIHSEVLLFLSKIKWLSVWEDPRANSTVNAITISSETNFVTRKNINAESFTVHLSAGEKVDNLESECKYYMWRQKFHVKPENNDEKRIGVEEWSITLAFPFEECLQRGTTLPGLYSYLPTKMITNFPFVIQADFLLQSSRETILFDNKWNKGILGCLPTTFINAFKSLVVETANVPAFNLPNMFRFLPVNKSSYLELNIVRDKIKALLLVEDLIPCESYTDQRFFHKPSKVGRLMPDFWNILSEAHKQGIYMHNLLSHGTKILESSFDRKEFDGVLTFLDIKFVGSEWYAKCIKSSNLLRGLSEIVYSELLVFLAVNWSSKFMNTTMGNIPLIKYVDINMKVSFCSINEAALEGGEISLFLAQDPSFISWLIDWNKEFNYVSKQFSLPEATQKAISYCSQKQLLLNWLSSVVRVSCQIVFRYADVIVNLLNNDPKLSVVYAHFLHHSYKKSFLTEHEVSGLCCKMPIVDVHGNANIKRIGVLLPGNGSKWAKLFDFNPWEQLGYVELGSDYQQPGNFGGMDTFGGDMIDFLKKYVGASDIPNLPLPDVAIPTFSSQLTKKNALVLLGWIYKKRLGKIPERFLSCVKEGNWLKVSLNKSPAYKPPSQTFVCSSQWGEFLQDGSLLVDIPLIDEGFYDNRILQYKKVLRKIGVRFEFGEVCRYIGECLMKMDASSSFTKGNVFSILNFIKFLRSKMVPIDDFVNSIKKGQWLRTSQGDKSPEASVLFDKGWRAAKQISDLSFIDDNYYGQEIYSYKDELKLLGVVIGFDQNYQLVIDHLKSPPYMNHFTANTFLFILQCIKHSGLSNKIAAMIQNNKCLKTNCGYRSPGECFLFDPEWGCLLQVFDGFPLVDESFYLNRMVSFKSELKKIGVIIDFVDASLRFASHFRKQAVSYSIRKEHVLSFMACCRKLKAKYEFPKDFMKCMEEVKWLRTWMSQHQCPKDCILFGSDWESISLISSLPCIDGKYYGEDIYKYKEELMRFGVIHDLKDGVSFVSKGLCIPPDPASISPVSVLSLLECIRMLQPIWESSIPVDFMAKVSKKWVKTHLGYVTPNKALLFSDKWTKFLQCTDGPFIDEGFYSSSIASFSRELHAIGVTVDVENGCQLLANSLKTHLKLKTIARIYNYLSVFKWKPNQRSEMKIWIPQESENGEWVGPKNCVSHDEGGLFSSHLYILDKHYDNKLLVFFSIAFEVRSKPSLQNYLMLWKEWECSGDRYLSVSKCCAFWAHVAGSWDGMGSTEKKSIIDALAKLPTDSGSRQMVWLGDKNDVFLSNNLHLKELFAGLSPCPIFLWTPSADLPSLSRSKLLKVFGQIGVRPISEAVRVEELSLAPDVEFENSRHALKEELHRIILGFLADPSVGMGPERRHEIVRRLLGLDVFETAEPILVSYSLSLSSGEVIRVKESRMVRWDRDGSKLFIQEIDAGSKRNAMEFAMQFSETISAGLLWDEGGLVGGLSELIKLASLVGFEREAVGLLMRCKNLEMHVEDLEFLDSTFPPPSVDLGDETGRRKRRKMH